MGSIFVTAVWLAYGSQCFLDATGDDPIAPIVFAGEGFRERGLKTPARWNLAEEPPHHLMELAVLSDGKRYTEVGEPPRLVVRWLPKPFDRGFTSAHYRTDTWTNVAGLRVPATFKFMQFDPDMSERTKQGFRVVCVVEGRLETFHDAAEVPLFGSDIPPRCRVMDYTLPRKGVPIRVFSYFTEAGTISDLGELRGLPDFQRQLAKGRSRWPAIHRITFCVLVSGVVCLPLIVLWWRRRIAAGESRR